MHVERLDDVELQAALVSYVGSTCAPNQLRSALNGGCVDAHRALDAIRTHTVHAVWGINPVLRTVQLRHLSGLLVLALRLLQRLLRMPWLVWSSAY